MVLRLLKYLGLLFLLISFLGMKPTKTPSLMTSHQRKVERVISRLCDNDSAKIISIDTEDIKHALILNDLKGSLFYLKHNSIIGYIYLGKANACHEGGCDRNDNEISQRFERFEYLIIFDNEKEIMHTQILKYEAEYGYEICSRRWLKQFSKSGKDKFDYGSDIQAIAGATVSAQSITDEINKLKQVVQLI